MDSKTNEQTHEKNHESSHRRRRWCWKFPFIIGVVILVKSAFVLLLWNHLVPDIFQGPTINYLQALGLLVLVKLLVGFGPHRRFGHGPWGHGGHPWKNDWSKLTPDEREKLRESIRHRCGQ